MISCRALGPVELRQDGEPVPPEILWRKNLGLLVYLARSPRRARSREHLTALLWGDRPEAAARQSLREAIRILRQHVGTDALRADGHTLRLADAVLELDSDRFEELVAAGNLPAAADLVGGTFLEGFSVPGASEFEDWLASERAHWTRRGVEVMLACSAAALARGAAPDAGGYALRALALDPVSAAAVRAAMRALAVSGDRAGAIQEFEAYLRRLGELGLEPDLETQQLAERVRREREWRLPVSVPQEPGRGAELRRPPLIGREDALERLHGAWEQCVRSRRATAAIIQADPGMGKTRLAEELLARVRLEGASVAGVRAVEADTSQPLSGLIGLARGGLLDAPGIAAAPPHALAALAREITEWAERFGRPLGPAPPLPAALREILETVTEEQPVVLLLDDAQWLDRDSLLAVNGAVRDLAAAPLYVCLCLTPEPARSEVDHLRAHLGGDVAGVALRLQPLGEPALQRLCHWALPGYDDTQVERLSRRLAAESAGIPLLAVEILHAVALGLDLGPVQGVWPKPFCTLDQSLPGDLPETVVAAIRIGFRRLGRDAQLVLKAAAVLGERTAVERLARATRLEDEALAQALDELEWQRWLTAEVRGYSFVARIVRKVIAQDMVTPGQRQRMLDAIGGGGGSAG